MDKIICILLLNSGRIEKKYLIHYCNQNTLCIFSLPASMTRITPLIPPATTNGVPSTLHAQLTV